MADHGRLFSAPMVRALLVGTKTQTRRLKGLPTVESQANGNWHIHTRRGGTFDVSTDDIGRIAADYVDIQPADRIWVREAWRVSKALDDVAPRDLDHVVMPEWLATDPELYDGRIRASMHLPRWASRLTLILTEVRVQRLQDISEEDARAEGLSPRQDGWFAVIDERRGLTGSAPDARAAYGLLWNVINGAGSWDANPWVAAYTFTVHHQNIDAMEKAA